MSSLKNPIFQIIFSFIGLSHSLLATTLDSLPEPTGAYQVGIAKIDLQDSYRKEVHYPAGRLIPIQIYFPTQVGSHVRHSKVFEERTPALWEPLNIFVYSDIAELSEIADGMHPLIILNHGDTVAMTDYAYIAEDLASHGYVVVTIQHQLDTDAKEPAFWKERSLSKHARVIDNILYVFEWLDENQISLFSNHIDLKKVGLIGHSMGGNSLLLLASRTSSVFKQKKQDALLPRKLQDHVKECIIVMDTGGFPFPQRSTYPLLFLLSEEREAFQRSTGCYDEMIKIGHKVRYYKGSKHISFMDHGYIDPLHLLNPDEHYFNGTLEERMAFFDQIRMDIREFLSEQLSSP